MKKIEFADSRYMHIPTLESRLNIGFLRLSNVTFMYILAFVVPCFELYYLNLYNHTPIVFV